MTAPITHTNAPPTKFAQGFKQLEETGIAVLLGLMTLLTFANVVARYVFNDNILWALEMTVFLFAWLVLLGASYAVKTHIHIGVDVVIRLVSPATARVLALLAVTACLAFAILLLIGAWQYWWPFATERAWLETQDIPMPEFLQFLSTWLNEGERYEKLPRFIPYFVLPLGMTLLTWRFAQVGWDIWQGQRTQLIANHEAESMIKEMDESSADQKPHQSGK